ncbi:MAG: DUF2225 domain-containing protein [Lachnospiraceae bacterium]|nr:DUF2225 domain-containing protein [Lachnospiraceae bacterium]
MAEEKDWVLRKTFTCPACDRKITDLKVKHGKTYLKSMDMDLKQNFRGIEPLKYSVIQCSYCGYTALEQYWDYLAPRQAKEIQIQITPKFRDEYSKKTEYSYLDAFKRYKDALMNAEIKKVKPSEMGLINLKLGWLYRSAAQSLDENTSGYKDIMRRYGELEDGYLTKALDYLLSARANESYPICGMNDITFETLIAALCAKYGNRNDAKRLVGNVLTSKIATKNAKDKAREIKDYLDEHPDIDNEELEK